MAKIIGRAFSRSSSSFTSSRGDDWCGEKRFLINWILSRIKTKFSPAVSVWCCCCFEDKYCLAPTVVVVLAEPPSPLLVDVDDRYCVCGKRSCSAVMDAGAGRWRCCRWRWRFVSNIVSMEGLNERSCTLYLWLGRLIDTEDILTEGYTRTGHWPRRL